MAKHDIHNPTKARRVIHDGISVKPDHEGALAVQKEITIGPGETKHGVELDDKVVKQLNDRVAKDAAAGRHDTELVVKPASGKTGTTAAPVSETASGFDPAFPRQAQQTAAAKK